LKVYISFASLKNIPKEEFEWIEEFFNGQERSYLVGVIHFNKLVKNDWWKQEGISLIAFPDSIIENLDVRNLKKRSLELAGIV
ncbi:MAG: homoserine dehydrogenase, partial [Ginsengibacter sp.]